MDNQLIVPKCDICGKEWSKISPLVRINDKFICGLCLPKLKEKIRKARNLFIEEAMND